MSCASGEECTRKLQMQMQMDTNDTPSIKMAIWCTESKTPTAPLLVHCSSPLEASITVTFLLVHVRSLWTQSVKTGEKQLKRQCNGRHPTTYTTWLKGKVSVLPRDTRGAAMRGGRDLTNESGAVSLLPPATAALPGSNTAVSSGNDWMLAA